MTVSHQLFTAAFRAGVRVKGTPARLERLSGFTFSCFISQTFTTTLFSTAFAAEMDFVGAQPCSFFRVARREMNLFPLTASSRGGGGYDTESPDSDTETDFLPGSLLLGVQVSPQNSKNQSAKGGRGLLI